MAEACVWKDVFSNDERIVLQRGYLITGKEMFLLFSFSFMTKNIISKHFLM